MVQTRCVECRACKNAEESQKHVVQECQSLNEDTENIEYEKIFNGSVLEKLKVARKFHQNYQVTRPRAHCAFWDNLSKFCKLCYYL